MNEKQQYLDKDGSSIFRMFAGNTHVNIDMIGYDGKSSRVCIPHDKLLEIVVELKKDITRKKKEHAKNIKTRNMHRANLCAGCRHNYYNFSKGQSANGDVAVSEDYYCWSIPRIKRGQCSAKSR